VTPHHARQRVEPFLDRDEAGFIDDGLLGVAAGVERELTQAVDERISLFQQRRKFGIDGRQVGAAPGGSSKPIGGGLLVAAAGLGQGQ
jgi:hypothetical protein